MCFRFPVFAGTQFQLAVQYIPTDSSSTPSATSYKIAYMGPLTGNQMLYGQIHTAALQIRVDEINAEGGINGVPIEVELFDDKTTPKKPLP